MRVIKLATLSLCFATGACSTFFPAPDTQTIGQKEQQKAMVSYGYQPIDPVPVIVNPLPQTATISRDQLMAALPDETMRMAIGQVDINGGITYGPASVSASGSDYIVTIDYVKSTTNSIPIMFIPATPTSPRRATLAPSPEKAETEVPAYVGVGLRLTANIRTTKAGINLGNLAALGVAAQAGDVSGTLVVQTLGLSGENISTALPIPTELTTSSIQTAIQALGTMKAKLYDTKTSVTPRVVGVYNNLGGGRETIDGFVSSLLERQQLLFVDGTPAPTAPPAQPAAKPTKGQSPKKPEQASKPVETTSSTTSTSSPPIKAGPAVSLDPARPSVSPPPTSTSSSDSPQTK